MNKSLASTLAVLLVITLVAPTVFFIAPQRVSADGGPGCVVGLAAGLGLVSAQKVVAVPVGDAANGVGSWTSAGSNVGNCIYNLIVVPVLRQMIRSMLQKMTQSTISWINGNNSTGQPSYVPNLAVHLQGVGDAVALAFIARAATAFNSPFGSAISFSLQNSYAQQTSMAGFFAANRSTLPGTPQNQQAFLAGNWSQGGIPAWFALTTQDNNNPYTLQQAAQSQLGSNVGQAQTNRRQDLIQGNGFLSYCGGDTTAKVNVNLRGGSINPQVSCSNPDGTPANVTTPGSTISSYLQANVNSGIGQLVSAQDLDSAIGQVVMALGNQVLGSTGLFGSQQPSSSNNTTPVSTTPSSSAASATSLAQSTLTNITTYTSAWQTITTTANAASAAITSLADSCPSQASAAQAALTTEIAPVLAQSQTAISSVSATQALALKVQAEAVAVPIADPIQFSTDVSSLTGMSPTSIDVVSVQSNAAVTGGSTANPAGSLTVSGGSLVDQMNLISTNAQALQKVCTYTIPNYFGGFNLP